MLNFGHVPTGNRAARRSFLHGSGSDTLSPPCLDCNTDLLKVRSFSHRLLIERPPFKISNSQQSNPSPPIHLAHCYPNPSNPPSFPPLTTLTLTQLSIISTMNLVHKPTFKTFQMLINFFHGMMVL